MNNMEKIIHKSQKYFNYQCVCGRIKTRYYHKDYGDSITDLYKEAISPYLCFCDLEEIENEKAETP